MTKTMQILGMVGLVVLHVVAVVTCPVVWLMGCSFSVSDMINDCED